MVRIRIRKSRARTSDPVNGIGAKLKGGEGRDAVHIAILPCVAKGTLSRGDEVELLPGTTNIVMRGKSRAMGGNPIGVIDPYLDERDIIKSGDKIWVFLFPGTVTGLRHEWSHPVIDKAEATLKSKAWLRMFADAYGFNYEEMVSTAQSNRSEGYTYLVAGTSLSVAGLGEDYGLFWRHLEVVTGKTFSYEHRESVRWTCSC